MTDDLVFSEGSVNDFKEAVDLMYKHEGWFVSPADYDAYKNGCQNGGYHFVVCRSSGGQFIGCVSIAILETDLAFIDNFYTIEECRGRGVGKKCFEKALTQEIRQNCNVGLHSDVKVSDYYAKKQRFTKFQKIYVEVFHLNNFSECMKEVTSGEFRVNDGNLEMNDVLGIDLLVWKKPRSKFLNAWILRKDAKVKVVYEGAEPIGYGAIRSSCAPNEFILGPVYLKNEEAFPTLLSALSSDLGTNAKLEIRSPSSSSERLCRLLTGIGTLDKKTKFITQFTKLLPDFNYEPVYCITDTSVPI